MHCRMRKVEISVIPHTMMFTDVILVFLYLNCLKMTMYLLKHVAAYVDSIINIINCI